MSERKNLDRLFQEKFKDFEAEPSELAWKNIEARLEEKKRRRVIPIWFQLTGVAAIFLIGTLVVWNWNASPGKNLNGNQVVTAPENGGANNNKSGDGNSVSPVGSETFGEPGNAVTDNGNSGGKASGTTSSDGISSDGANTDASASDKNPSETKSAKRSKTTRSTDFAIPDNAVTETNAKTVKNRANVKLKNSAQDGNTSGSNASGIRQENSGIALYPEKNAKGKKRNSVGKNKIGTSGSGLNPSESENIRYASAGEKSAKAKNGKSKSANAENSEQIAQNDSKSNKSDKYKNNVNIIDNEKIAVNENNQSGQTEQHNQEVTAKTTTSTQAIAAKIDDIKKDSTALAMAAKPNALEELLNIEKEKSKSVTQNEPKMNRWQVSPRVAPIYSSSNSNGSPIDSRFAGNEKDFKTQISYGLGVGYALNKRLTVRTGVNSLAFEYNTNNVVASQSTVGRQQLQHVKPTVQGAFLRIQNKNESAPIEFTNSGLVMKEFSSSLSQKTGYLEVPLELSYKLLDKRFGIDVIGGFSTLFLNQNEVALVSDGNQMQVGQANNLNDMSFSTNIGIGMRYNILKSLQFNFEPMFKYQLNTYTESGNFKPYFFGLYTGLNYRF
ncbi:hypothetical protein [Flavobacterium sp.]|uniref:hypothetical protein n=1 Tax=Flavobacterium sp. TaxID=239 RepID=UPI001228981D|nr:hypothetical protein [Flavobacterium sp.]RZJ72014.1 MAG: hypothetical protein EOO49_08275 [Flavobacterium sp.]